MRILTQNYSNGNLEMLEVPMITCENGLLVQTKVSLVSIGTERAMIDIAKKSLLEKALARPDWVKKVIDKIKTEGFMEAWRQSKARLDMPVPLGYSCSGIVREINNVQEDFCIGDRVACGGSGYASHSEYNVVPANLCVKIPDNISFEDASYVAIGGIAMQSIRLAKIEFGYKVGVIGLGLLGQIGVQILKAAGCHVFGIDISESKCNLALQNGAEVVAVSGKDNPVKLAKEFSDYNGLDAVIILASVNSDEPLIHAADMCRERGRIIASGLVGLNIPRDIFYKKELDFAVSRSSGPGMYDPDYEERGLKYPFAYARWTAKRNMEEFLKMVSLGTVKLGNITTHKFHFEDALSAYQIMLLGKELIIGMVLQYPDSLILSKSSLIIRKDVAAPFRVRNKIGVGLIGAGLFTRGTLLPAMKKASCINLIGVASSHGLSAKALSDSQKFQYATSDYLEILNDKNIDIVFILTRHNSHSKFVCDAIKSGKAVFVEKPLCINEQELKEIINIYITCNTTPFLMVGFNRRFAPTTRQCIEFIKQSRESSVVQIRCNAGFIPSESWIHKKGEGGGRIIGEVCHFVDLAQAITGGLPKRVFASCIESSQGLRDNLTISMKMDNGSVVGITYTSNGDSSFPKDEIQVFAKGSVCIIENFKNIQFISSGKKKAKRNLKADKGYIDEIEATCDAIKNCKPSPIDFKSIVATTLTTFAIEKSITTGEAIDIDLKKFGID